MKEKITYQKNSSNRRTIPLWAKIAIALILIITVSAFIYATYNSSQDQPNPSTQQDSNTSIPPDLNELADPTPTIPIAQCTTDTQECPDGSTVERSGPFCEFEPCPALQNE